MSYTVYIDYGGGWVDLTNYSGKNLVRYNGFQKIQQIHDEDCRVARNSAQFQIDSDINLIPHLMNVEEIKVQIEKDGALWFKGYARPVTTFTASVDGDVIDFEAFDSSWLLERSIQSDVKYINQYLCNTSDTENSIIHDLLNRAGVASGDINITVDILQQITVTFEEGTRYIDAIGDILWDYHHVLDVSDGGKLYVYDWAPETIPAASHTFEENNTVRQIEISKNDIDEDQVRVHYHELIEKTGITLCKKTYSDVTTPTVFKVLTTDVCYEWDGSEEYASVEDNESAKNWPSIPGRFKFENPVEDSEWLNTSNHAVSWTNERFWNSVFIGIGAGGKTDNNEVSLVSSAFGVSYADLQFYIQSPDKPWYSSASWNTIRKVVVTGDAQLLKRHANKTNLIPATGNTVKEYKANYIYDGIIAVALATAMAHHLEYGRWIYKWQSEDEVDIGDYVRIYNTTSLNVDTIVRVIKKSWNEVKKIFDYKAIGVTDLGTPVGSVISGTYAVVPPGDVIDTVDRVNEGLDDLGNIKKVIKGSALNTEGEESIKGVSGLYFTAEFIGFYNGDESVDDWTARIKDDGTFKFLGNADNFIEWDGTSLAIQGDLQSANYSAGSAGWQINNAGAAEFNEVTVRGTIVADNGDVGGWIISADSIQSAADGNNRIELNPGDNRVEIWSGATLKAALGYLGGIGSYTATDFGLYVADGNTVKLEGGGDLTGDDYLISSDGAIVIDDGSGGELARFGSMDGSVGFQVGDPDTGEGIKYTVADGLVISGGLQAQFASLTTTLTIGYAGTGSEASPDDGDRKVYLDEDEIIFSVYRNAAWSTTDVVKFGGVDSDDKFVTYGRMTGIVHPANTAPRMAMLPEATCRIFDCENDAEDQHGVDNWSGKTDISYSSGTKKFGTYSMYCASASTTGYLSFNSDMGDINLDDDAWAFGGWFYTGVSTSAVGCNLLWITDHVDTDNGTYIYAGWNYNGGSPQITVTIQVKESGSFTYNDSSTLSITANAWHYIALVHHAGDHTVTLVVDDQQTTEDAGADLDPHTGGTFSGHFDIKNNDGYATYLDEVLVDFETDIAVADVIQHYNDGVTWNTDYALTDVIIEPEDGGRVVIDGAVISADGTLADDSDQKIPTEKAVKTYVDNASGGNPTATATTDYRVSCTVSEGHDDTSWHYYLVKPYFPWDGTVKVYWRITEYSFDFECYLRLNGVNQTYKKDDGQHVYTYDLTVEPGDIISLYFKSTRDGRTATIDQLKLGFTLDAYNPDYYNYIHSLSNFTAV